MKTLDLLVIGEANPDLILAGGEVLPAFGQQERLVDSATLTLGGSSTITACGAAKLGLSTAFVGVVGDDVFGRFVLDTLRGRGVDVRDCSVEASIPTGVTVVLNRGDDRAMLSTLGTTGRMTADLVPRRLLHGARHVHCGSLFLQADLLSGLPGLFAEAREAGATTSFDTNWDPSERWEGIGPLLSEADIFFPNEQELAHIAGVPDGEDAAIAAASLASGGLIVVKRGNRGAIAYRDGAAAEHPAFRVEPVDATGAGDSFNAGFIAATLADEPMRSRLALGCACGALSTRSVGGITSQPSRAEALALIEAQR